MHAIYPSHTQPQLPLLSKNSEYFYLLPFLFSFPSVVFLLFLIIIGIWSSKGQFGWEVIEIPPGIPLPPSSLFFSPIFFLLFLAIIFSSNLYRMCLKYFILN